MRRTRPHLFLAFDFRLEGFCRERTLFFNAGFYSVMAYLALVRADIPRVSEFVLEARKLPFPHRIKFHRDERRVMGEMFK